MQKNELMLQLAEQLCRKNKDAIDAFNAWYSSSGHWIYDTRKSAAKTWIKHGIDNLPDAPNYSVESIVGAAK